MRTSLLAALACASLLTAPVHAADVAPPSSGITAPASAAVNSLPTLSGTAADTGGSHVASVKIRIQELTTFTYFNSGTGSFDFFLAPPAAWFDADPLDGAFDSDSEVWMATATAAAVIAGIEGPYRIEAYAVDGAANDNSSAPSSLAFFYDVSAPLSSVADPVHGSHRLAMSRIVGGQADFVTGVSTVQVRVQDMTTGLFWDGGSSFGAAEVWSTATLAGPTFTQAFSAPLNYGTTYQIVSKAFDFAGNVQTDFSVGFASVSFLLDNSPPSTAAVTAITTGSASAAWALIGGATGYNLVTSLTSANPPTVLVSSQTSTESETHASVTGLSPNTTYFFFVRAQGPAAATAYSLFATSPTLASPPVTAAAAGVTNASASMTWGANSNPADTTFVAEASTSSGFGVLAGSSVTLNAAATFSGLNPNTTYFMRVKALNYAGVSTAYAASVSSATDANAPVSPGASVGLSNQVTMTWSANSNPAGSVYVAEISTDSGFNPVQASSRTLSVSAVFSSLASATTYYLRVKTAGRNGSDTAYSASTSAVTGVAPPDAISGTITTGGVGVQLVRVELYDSADARVGAPVFTDNLGAWSFSGLTAAVPYKLTATYMGTGGSSQIFQAGHFAGEAGVTFNLELGILLGSITGTLRLAPGTVPAGIQPGGRAASTSAHVDVYQNGVKSGSFATDSQGRFAVTHLLPGTYALRPYNGSAYGGMVNATVASGQQAVVTFSPSADLLPMDGVYFYPNPARDHAVIRFTSAAASQTAEAAIFDLTGGLVRTLGDAQATRAGGETSWTWDMTNSHGTGVASGVYLVRVTVVDASAGRRATVTKKLAVVR